MSQNTEQVDISSRYPRIPSRSLHASKLIEHLKALPEGTEVSYAELGRVAGVDVDTRSPRGWAALWSARRYLESTTGAVWECLVGQRRIKRLNSTERVRTVDRNLEAIGRRVRRTARRAATVDLNALPESDRTAFLVTMGHVGALGMAVGARARRRIEDAKAYSERDALASLLK